MSRLSTPLPRPSVRGVAALATFTAALLGYAVTLAPTVTFWDSGEFITASYTLGIPHPPGTPLFVLLGRVATLLPLPVAVAVKTNLLAALGSAVAALFWFLCVHYVLERWLVQRAPGGLDPWRRGWLAAAGAAAAALLASFGLAIWQSSTETEVYSLAYMTVAIVTWLGLDWRERRGEPGADNRLLLVALLMGLSVGTHLMAMLCLPGVALFVGLVLWRERRAFLLSLACGVVGTAIILLKAFDADAWIAGRDFVKVQALLTGGLLLALGLWSLVRVRAAAFFALALLFFAAGTSVFLYLKIRAGLHPVVNLADPSSWQSLVEVILRRQYDVRPPFPRTVDFFQLQLPLYLDYLFGRFGPLRSAASSQFGGPGAVGAVVTLAWVGLAVRGAVEHARADRQSFLLFLSTFLTTSLGLVVWLNFRAGFTQAPELTLPREVRERDYFFLVSFALLGLWGAMGAFTLVARTLLLRRPREREAPGASAALAPTRQGRLGVGARVWGVALATLVLPLVTFALNHREADRSGNTIARDWAYNLLQSARPFGIVFSNGDNDTYPLWYVQEVEGVRRDVVVATLPLMNTTWYLEQLESGPFRGAPPAVPMRTGLAGEAIATAEEFPQEPVLRDSQDLPLYLEVREPVNLNIQTPVDGRRLELALQPRVLRRQDLAVLKLLGQQLGVRPVYFSTTVSPESLVSTQPYLVRVGMLNEVGVIPAREAAAADERLFEVPENPDLVYDVPRTDALLWQVYRYGDLVEPAVFKDPTTVALTTNLRITLLAMARIYAARNDAEKARRALELATRIVEASRPT